MGCSDVRYHRCDCPWHTHTAAETKPYRPQELSPALCRTYITQPLLAGMIVSNEPGYYEDGAFGIRIENLLHIQEADTQFHFGGQSYFSFERLTLVPLQRKMLKMEVSARAEALNLSHGGWLRSMSLPHKMLVYIITKCLMLVLEVKALHNTPSSKRVSAGIHFVCQQVSSQQWYCLWTDHRCGSGVT